MLVSVPHAGSSWRNRERVASNSPGNGVIGCCEPSCGCYEVNSGPLEEQSLFSSLYNINLNFIIVFIRSSQELVDGIA